MPRVARDLLPADPLTVAAATPVLDVQHLLVLAQVGAMPVVEEDGKVIGVVTAADVMRTLDQVLDADLDDGEHDDVLAPLRAITARDIAHEDTLWVEPDTASVDIAARMRAAQVPHVLVGIDGALDGMLTAYDLLVDVA
ncbi:MAG: CBS domain-containing protein [Deltaproteobacteria bacterium]|nr:CBS domain-containing protein [Deltaproteobacteria bacterium]